MTTNRQDFEMTAGKAKSIVFTVTGQDLTAASALTWRMGKTPNGAATLERGIGSGVTVNSATQCTVAIAVGAIPDDGVYWHELDATVGGNIYPLARGRGFVSQAPATPE